MISANKKQRNCGVDCLRSVAMFAIVLQHCILHSNIVSYNDTLSVKYGLADFVTFFCFGAVNTYLLISGYVNIDAKYKPSRIMQLWIEVVFYCLIITAISAIMLKRPITGTAILKAVTPIIHHEYWFFTRYVLLFLLMPIINTVAHRMSKKSYRIFLAVVYVLFCFVVPVIKKYTGIDIFLLKGGYSTVWFVAMYMTGAYFKLHFEPKKKRKTVYLLGFTVFSLLLYLDNEFIPAFVKQYRNMEISSVLSADTYSSPFTVLAVVFVLLLFINLDFSDKAKKLICTVGPLTFGVYIISDNPIVRDCIISKVPQFIDRNSGNLMVIWIILFAAAVFISCLLLANLFKKIPPIYNLYFADLVNSCGVKDTK